MQTECVLDTCLLSCMRNSLDLSFPLIQEEEEKEQGRGSGGDSGEGRSKSIKDY